MLVIILINLTTQIATLARSTARPQAREKTIRKRLKPSAAGELEEG